MVRSFSRVPFTRAAVVIVSAAVLMASGPGSSTAASADDNLHNKRNQVRSQISKAAGALSESSGALQTATGELLASRAALAAAQRDLVETQTQVAEATRTDALMRVRQQQAEQDLLDARTAAQTAKLASTQQRSAIGELAASNYINGDPALIGLSVILRSQNPSQATVQLNTVSALMSRQTTLLTGLRAARRASISREADVRVATDTVTTQRRQTAVNLDRKQDLMDLAVTAEAQVSTLVARSRAAEVAARRARGADAVQLRVLKEQDQRIRQLIVDRARRQRGGYTGQTGGFLFRPVPGYETSPFGWRIHPIYGYRGFHDGVDFHAPCGSPVRSVGGGTVISKVWSDVYGNRLFVDLGKANGKSMTAVYNHLDSYTVRDGQRVIRGAVIARAGNTGWSTGCHLHLTILVNGNPANPMDYM